MGSSTSVPTAGDFVEVRTRRWLVESMSGADALVRARLSNAAFPNEREFSGAFATVVKGGAGGLLELLKQVAPDVMRAGVIRDPALTSWTGQFGAIQSTAPLVGWR